MKRTIRTASKQSGAQDRRIILYMEPDPSFAETLHDAWVQFQFADALHIVHSCDEALQFLNSIQGSRGDAPVAAVVLDPDATGEDTGAFVRDVRKYCGNAQVPIVFWSRNSDKYKVLEGLGVESVLHKPMVMRLIQSLDAACKLKVQHVQPFAGNHGFKHAYSQPGIGVGT